jgi:hypothetical protein
VKYFAIMVFQTTLLVIVVRNLSLTFGSTYVMGSESLANISSAYHPKIDGQIEHTNQTLE